MRLAELRMRIPEAFDKSSNAINDGMIALGRFGGLSRSRAILLPIGSRNCRGGTVLRDQGVTFDAALKNQRGPHADAPHKHDQIRVGWWLYLQI